VDNQTPLGTKEAPENHGTVPAATLGVVIPTLNCAGLLPAHLDSLRHWIDLATEVVVVDSQSEDGTVEIIRECLKHPGLRILQHPRGLYQSWNFGISQLNTKYTYVSTVGDTITRSGMRHLLKAAEQFQCDGVLSRPRFIAEHGCTADPYWPIDDLLTALRPPAPMMVESIILFFYALQHIPAGILGSSASNLYRTDILKRHPFPLDFGTTGDAAWGLAHVMEHRFAVTPEIISTFRFHPKAYSADEYAVRNLADKMLGVARETIEKKLSPEPSPGAVANGAGWEQLIRAASEYRRWKVRLDSARHRTLPWFLSPQAWKARSHRNYYRKLYHSCHDTVMNSLK
jgi:hypothetical protein